MIEWDFHKRKALENLQKKAEQEQYKKSIQN